jgi:hypothetical protein
MPQVVTGAALGTDVLAMAGILGLIVLFGLLYRYRRQSATWGRIAKLALVLAAIGVFAFWQYCRDQEAAFREGRARDVIELVGIEKSVDAINMFEDIVRIQFRFRNMSRRTVESFGVQFMVRDPMGQMLINDQISVTSKIPSGQTSSWSVKYWATCPQDFSADAWEKIVRTDIQDFEVEWFADGLVFEDGEVIR